MYQERRYIPMDYVILFVFYLFCLMISYSHATGRPISIRSQRRHVDIVPSVEKQERDEKWDAHKLFSKLLD